MHAIVFFLPRRSVNEALPSCPFLRPLGSGVVHITQVGKVGGVIRHPPRTQGTGVLCPVNDLRDHRLSGDFGQQGSNLSKRQDMVKVVWSWTPRQTEGIEGRKNKRQSNKSKI